MRKLRIVGLWSSCCMLALAVGCGSSDGSNGGGTVGGPVGTVGGPAVGSLPSGAAGMSGGPVAPVGTTTQAAGGVPCDVANVVGSHCTLCHGTTPAFGAPMSLMTYADFHAQAKSDATKKVYELIPGRINATEISKRMPPASQPALPAADLQTLSSWASAGAMPSAQACAITTGGATGMAGGTGTGVGTGAAGAGGTTTMPMSPTVTEGTSDKPIEYNDPMMKCYQFLAHDPNDKMQPYQVTTTPDQYTNFTFMPAWQGMMYVRSFRAVTGNMQVIHHWLFYKDSAAVTDGAVGPSSGAHPDGELMDGWAPGGSDMYLAPDTGEEMPGDVGYTLETHHNNVTGATAPDASGIEVCVTPTVPANVASLSWLGTDNINGTMATGTCTPTGNVPIHIIGGSPHMHLKGNRQTVIITRADGTMETLHDQPFDFNYQHSYPDSTIINPGDSLTTTCYYSSPATFGEKTTDEMCYYFTLYYPKLSLTNGNPIATLIHGPNTCL